MSGLALIRKLQSSSAGAGAVRRRKALSEALVYLCPDDYCSALEAKDQVHRGPLLQG